MNRRGTDVDRPVVIERSIFTLTPTHGTRPGVPFVLTPFAPRLAARHDVYLPDAANPPDIANAVILPCSDTPGARRCNGFEDMLPLTLGANIGTTITGIMAATVVTSNPVQAWQVALCHLFFNVFGIVLWYPIPKVRQIPLNGARFLGKMTTNPKWGKIFPLVYTFVVFFIIPGIAYAITAAATA